jgi:hypothetical protein
MPQGHILEPSKLPREREREREREKGRLFVSGTENQNFFLPKVV